MRWMNRVATATILLTILAGPPLLAAWLVPWPDTWPTRGKAEAWLEQPLSAGTIVAGCVAVAVLGWLLLLSHLTRQGLTELRRRWRRWRRLPLPTPAQLTASSMAGIAALTLPGLSPPESHPDTAAVAPLHHPAEAAPPDPVRDHTVTISAAGVDLPGGSWIPISTALAASAATSLVWARRRQYYQPAPRTGAPDTRDHDLQQMPATVDAVTAAVTSRPHYAVVSTPALVDLPPHAAITLTGDGAVAAARGLLVTAALRATTGPERIKQEPHIEPRDAGRLLPGVLAHDLAIAGIHLDDTRPPSSPPVPGGRPALLGEPERPLAATGADPPREITVRLGIGPAATVRWHVTRDGTATGTGISTPQRLCVLDAQAAADLLTLVRRARGHDTADLSADPTTSAGIPRQSAPTPTPRPQPPAQLTLIGGYELTADGAQVRLSRSAAAQILSYLAIHPDGATRTDLIRACWPGGSEASITQRLHTTLTDLRKQLQPLLDADPIRRHDDRYYLNEDAIDTDLRPWRTAVHAATHLIDSQHRLDASRTLITLYRGELAAGQRWPWLTPARETLHRDLIDAYTALARAAAPPQALALLEQAITIDPYNQQVHEQAVATLHATGDHAGAAQLMDAYRTRLAAAGLKPT